MPQVGKRLHGAVVNRDQIIVAYKKINFDRADFFAVFVKVGKKKNYEVVAVVSVDFGPGRRGDNVFEIKRVKGKVLFKINQVRVIRVDDVYPAQIFGMYDFERHFLFLRNSGR